MAALLLLLLLTMGLYQWTIGPLVLSATWLLEARWLPVLPFLGLVWLLAGRR
jgi:hypothetical protein